MDTAKRRLPTLMPGQPFLFSQAALQDYQDCRRRFQLRYLLKAAWPAPQAEPVREHEKQIRRGERFHRLAQQSLSGVPVDRLAGIALADPDEILAQWWEQFRQALPRFSGEKRFVETMLSVPLGQHRLLAKFDLLVLLPNSKLVIFDWKTSLKPPRREWLENRWQTRVYLYLAAQAASGLGQSLSFSPEQVEMEYWFTAHPDSPVRFSYSHEHLQRDEIELLSLVQEIERLPENAFERTSDERHCKFCVYRSYCDRGASAGQFEDNESEFEAEGEIEINFDQIAEISF